MRSGRSANPRQSWHDRAPSQKIQKYIANALAPHSATERWSYTVPAGKKAYVEWMQIAVTTVVVATSGRDVVDNITLTPDGGSAIDVAYLAYFKNGVGDNQQIAVGSSMILLPGDEFASISRDSSTGGTITHVLIAKITEFDA